MTWMMRKTSASHQALWTGASPERGRGDADAGGQRISNVHCASIQPFQTAAKCCQIFWVVKRNQKYGFFGEIPIFKCQQVKNNNNKNCWPNKTTVGSLWDFWSLKDRRSGKIYGHSFLPSVLILDLEDWGQIKLVSPYGFVTGAHFSSIISSRFGNALIKHQVVEMAGSEVTNKMTSERHLLLKSNWEKGPLEFVPVSFGTNWALGTALTAFVSF